MLVIHCGITEKRQRQRNHVYAPILTIVIPSARQASRLDYILATPRLTDVG